MPVTPFDGTSDAFPIGILVLDSRNPRLPEIYRGASQHELREFIANTYSAIEIAKSIALHGYFPSEPPIVISNEDGTYTVVEGNRRLVALQILSDPTLAASLDDYTEWQEVAKDAHLPDIIPVIVATDRQEVAPIIGYRHISGIQPWEPFAKARFIAALVDEQNRPFEDVADLVGERTNDVAAQYRNQQIVGQAEKQFGLDAKRVVRTFGVFTRAMTSVSLRNYIGAPAPMDVVKGQRPLPDDAGGRTKEFFSWVFGDESHDPVIKESRQITDLGTIVASGDGLQILQQTRDFATALIAAGGLRDRLVRRLTQAT